MRHNARSLRIIPPDIVKQSLKQLLSLGELDYFLESRGSLRKPFREPGFISGAGYNSERNKERRDRSKCNRYR